MRHSSFYNPARIPTYSFPNILSFLSRFNSTWLQRRWYEIFVKFLSNYSNNYSSVASRFFSTFSTSLSPSHSAILHHLSTLLLPAHVQNDELAQRFRNEKYAIRMSRSGFSLLVGWLTEGVGGEALGAGDGFTGERGKRGRATVMRVVNNHLRFDGKFQFMYFLYVPCIHKQFSHLVKSNYRFPSRMGGDYRSPLVLDPSNKRG